MARQTGFEKPYEKIQVVTWVYFVLLNFFFYGVNCICQLLCGGARERKDLLVALVVLYTILSVSTFVTAWMCTAKNVTDPLTLKVPVKKEGSEEEDDKKRNAGAFGRKTSLKNASLNEQKIDLGVAPCTLKLPEKCKHGNLPSPRADCGCELAERHLLNAPYCSPAMEQSNVNSSERYCHYCKSHTHISSKHCRSCDRCTIGFDHHCRFINNCVGKRNYSIFLMAVSLSWLWLSLQIGMTVWIIIYNEPVWLQALEIIELVLLLIPWFPVAHLLVFHLVLLYKGISTYSWLLIQKSSSKKGLVMYLTCCRKCKMCRKVMRKLPPLHKIKKGLDNKYSITKVPETVVITVQEKKEKEHFECCRSPKRTVQPDNSAFEGDFRSKDDEDNSYYASRKIL